MKNIHVLPTDKPSRLYYNSNQKHYRFNFNVIRSSNCIENQNIYITSDEEIKEGDYYLYLKDNSVQQFIKKHHTKLLALDIQKKIILTTDQDLIEDGVQEIPEYFLIHYIIGNNPVEYVQIKEHLESIDTMKINYELIIPKKEPKTVFDQLEVGKDYKQEVFELGEEPKQETLEESAKNESEYLSDWEDKEMYQRAFKDGAKWQQEQMCNHNYILTSEQGHRVIKCSKCNNTQPI